MIELLDRIAQAGGARAAVISQSETATFSGLTHDARVMAAEMSARGIDRLALVEPDVALVVPVLAAASLVGVEVCQYQADTPAAQLVAEMALLGEDVLLTTREDLGAPTTLRPADLSTHRPHGGAPGPDRPLIVRTTGTTGEPKAVLHDWSVLLRTISAVQAAPEQRWLLAYGPHQFAGLQVMLHALAAGAHARRSVPAGSAGRVACHSRARGDPRGRPRPRTGDSCWGSLNSGGRPGSRAPTDHPGWRSRLADAAGPALRATFGSARITQVYASTEFGSLLAVGDGQAGIDATALEGTADAPPVLKVVDGELWVRPRAGMRGYVGDGRRDSTATQAADQWVPTGDLVRVVQGRIEFLGRKSDIINVGGVKVHPLPVEERVKAVPGVVAARVYGRSNALTGALVAVDVVAGAQQIWSVSRTPCGGVPGSAAGLGAPRSGEVRGPHRHRRGQDRAGSRLMSASGRVIVITGGSKGLGAGLVSVPGHRRHRGHLCPVTDGPAQVWAQTAELDGRFLFHCADITRRSDADAFIRAVLEEVGQIDVLVNNAGVARDGVVALLTDEDVDAVVDLNLKGTLYVTRAVARHMLTRRQGAIVNISSIVGLSGYRGLGVYSATKAGLDGLTRSLARFLRVQGHHGQQRGARLHVDGHEPRSGRGAAGPDPPPHPHGSPGHARGGRPSGALRVRSREQLHHRPDDRGRWRTHLLTGSPLGRTDPRIVAVREHDRPRCAFLNHSIGPRSGDLTMNKLVTGLLALVLATFGVVAVAPSPAAADPYPGTVNTTTTVKYRAQVRRKHRFSMRVTVSASGNVSVTGSVSCTVRGKKGSYTLTRQTAYNGSQVKIRTGEAASDGSLSLRLHLQPEFGLNPGFKSSSDNGKFRVRGSRRGPS